MTLMGELLDEAKPKGAKSARKFADGTFGGRTKVVPNGVGKKEPSDAQALAQLKAKAPAVHEEARNTARPPAVAH